MQDISRADFETLFESGAKQAMRILQDRARAEDEAAEAMGRLITDGKDRKHFKLIVHGQAVDAYRSLQKERPVNPLAEDGNWGGSLAGL